MIFRSRLLAAVALVAAGAGGLIGAGVVALSGGGGTTTVVREQTVQATGAAPISGAKALPVGDIYRRTSPGVVEIVVNSNDQTVPNGGSQSQGSGFFYDDEHVVTNEHVVDGASSVTVRLSDGSTHKATVLGTDPSTDLAVLKVDVQAGDVTPLTLGNSANVSVGDGVVAIGSPFGLENTVTTGIVSALHREISSPNNFTIGDAIQTDAAINHGNSGGVLLDLNGNVIGVTAQIKSDSGGNDGVGFAIPSNTVKRVVSQLLATGKVAHPYLGVTLAPEGNARIGEVQEGTPAAQAGLRAGDVVTSIDGRTVTSGAELRSLIDGHKPGDTIRLTLRRGGSTKTVTVKLTTRPRLVP